MSDIISADKIQNYVRELLSENPEIKNVPEPVMLLMANVMQHFKGGLSPLTLRPLLIVEVHGAEAARNVVESIRRESISLRDFCIDRPDINKRLDELDETLNALLEHWNGIYNGISRYLDF